MPAPQSAPLSPAPSAGGPANLSLSALTPVAVAKSLELIELTHAGAKMTVSPFGAHVTSFVDVTGRELLYMSPTSDMTGEKPIRGGRPIVGPVFGDGSTWEGMKGTMDLHGFFRTMQFEQIVDVSKGDKSEDGLTRRIHFRASSNDETLKKWPHQFQLDVIHGVSSHALETTVMIYNPDQTKPLELQFAFHTYIACDAANTTVSELAGKQYHDAYDGLNLKTAEGPLVPQGVNRIYENTGEMNILNGPDGLQILVFKDRNLKDAVLWNPAGKQNLGDLPDADHGKFCCLESGAIYNRIIVPAGGTLGFREIVSTLYKTK